MSDNNIILALSIAERTQPMLLMDTREAISASRIFSIEKNINTILQKLMEANCKDGELISALGNISELINTFRSEPDFEIVSYESKNVIIKNFKDAMHRLRLFVVQYYITHDFDCTPLTSGILNKAIDECLISGYYLGFDKSDNPTQEQALQQFLL